MNMFGSDYVGRYSLITKEVHPDKLAEMKSTLYERALRVHAGEPVEITCTQHSKNRWTFIYVHIRKMEGKK